MSKISTSYLSYQELLLDLDIFGSIIKEPPINKDEYKKLLFDEYKRTHHKVSLEDRRYELSDLVSSDFHVNYVNEIELKENEELIDLSNSNDEEYSVVRNLEKVEVPEEIKGYFSLDRKITDENRLSLLNTLDYFKETNDIEEFNGDIDEVEKNFGTVIEDTTNIYEDNDEDDEYDDVYEDDSDSEEIDDNSGEEDSEDYEYEDSYDEDDSEEDENEEDDDYDVDYESDESDDEDDEYEDSYDDYSEDDIENNDRTTSIITNNDSEDEVGISKEVNNNSKGFIDSVFSDNDDEVIDFIKEDKTRKVEIPKSPVMQVQKKQNVVREVIDRDSEPKTLREFLRKHPHSDVSFVLKYFSKKEVQKEIMMGTVIKKGNKLHI